MLFIREKSAESLNFMNPIVFTESNFSWDDMALLSDSDLWDFFKKGNSIAFITIYSRYYNLLFSYGCKLINDKESVRDCLQDFFIYLWEKRKSISGTNSIRPYVVKSFGRRIIEYANKQKIKFSSIDSCDYIHLGVEPCVLSNFVSKQVKDLQTAQLNHAIQTLDSTERKAIYYFYYGGLSYEQLAGLLEFSHVSSARRIIYRSIKKLRNSLKTRKY